MVAKDWSHVLLSGVMDAPSPNDQQDAPRLSRKQEAILLAKFVAVGVVNTCFGYGVFVAAWLLTHSNIEAVVVGNVLGSIFNYFTTGKLVFANHGFRSLVPFLLGYAVALCVNLILVQLLTQASVPPLLAGAISLPFLILLSYLYNRCVVFRKTAH